MSEGSTSGIGFGGLLQVAFIVLRLTGQIDWSWWWVLAPTWLPLGTFLLVVGLLALWTLSADD